MAEASLLIYPQDKNFVPEQAAIDRAIDILNEAGDFDGISYESWQTPHFISSGDALERVSCPKCDTEINADDEDYQEWWYDTMDGLATAESGEDFQLNMPCCEAEILAKELKFADEASFVRFVLKLSEPLDDVEISAEQFAELEQLLQCKLNQMIEIWA